MPQGQFTSADLQQTPPPVGRFSAADIDAPQAAEGPGLLDREIPLTSHWNATLSGMQSIGRGLRDAAKGTYDTFIKAPADDTEKKVATTSGVGGLALYRTLRGVGHTLSDATDLVGAIHDINAGPDPLGSYAKAAQETAGQGAGQALTALFAEETVKAAPKVAEIVKPAAEAIKKVTPKQAAQVLGGAGGAVAGHGPLSVPGAYYGAKTAGSATESILGTERANAPIFNRTPPPEVISPPMPAPAAPIASPEARVLPSGEAPTPGAYEPVPLKASAAAQKAYNFRPSIERIIDDAIPAGRENSIAKNLIESHLKRGDLAGAENALDTIAKEVDPKYQPSRSAPVTVERRGVDPELQGWYQGPERRTGLPARENLGFDWSPPKDIGTETRAKVEAAMGPIKRGSKTLTQAEALQQAAMTPQTSQTQLPEFLQREAPQVVPSVQNIRENLAMQRAAESTELPPAPSGYGATAEDRAIQQEMAQNLETHGYRAESEARRAFIARNSTGVTKGELTRATAKSSSAGPVPAGTQVPQTAETQMELLQKMLKNKKLKDLQ